MKHLNLIRTAIKLGVVGSDSAQFRRLVPNQPRGSTIAAGGHDLLKQIAAPGRIVKHRIADRLHRIPAAPW